MIYLWLVASSLAKVLAVAPLGGWGGLCLVLQQCWLFSVAQRLMWDGSLQVGVCLGIGSWRNWEHCWHDHGHCAPPPLWFLGVS